LEITKGQLLRVQASIRAWPNIFGARLFHYPENVYGLKKADWGRVELREKDLRITIDLQSVRLQRLKRPGLPGSYQQPVGLDKQGRIGFWFSLLIVLLDGAKACIKVQEIQVYCSPRTRQAPCVFSIST
jgi:hypothetical protein